MSAGAASSRGANRTAWIDHLKCWGIFLVVYGHSGIIHPLADRWIYAFHIPLFFLVSGYLLRDEYLAAPWPAFLGRTVRALLPAYLLFALFNYAVWLLLLRRFGQNTDLGIPPLYPLLAIFYGTGTPPSFHLQPLVLWFFPCLFSAQLLAYGVHRAGPKLMWAGSAALCVLGFLLPKWLALPMELESALVAQAFLVLGIGARRAGLFSAPSPRWMLGLLGVVAGTLLALLNERVDMRSSAYGNPVLFFGAALGLTAGFVFLAQLIPRSAISEVMARNTILIFPLHPFVFTVFSAVFVLGLHRDLSFKSDPVVTLVTSILNCAIIVASAPLFGRLIPLVYGFKKREAAEARSSAVPV